MPPETIPLEAVPLPEGSPPALAICLFGPLDVRRDGTPVPRLRSRKGGWLLALLVLRAGRQVERDWLAALLWPESSPERAGHSLRMSLKDLRRALGAEAYRLRSPTPRSLCLDLEGADVDLLTFDAAIQHGDPRSLAEAVALYRGPLLEGCAEEWAFQERQAREQAYLAALETLGARALAGGEACLAERYLRRAVGVDPLRESAQRALMRALAAGRNYAAALLVYRELRLRLHRELNAAPDPETQALFQQLRAEVREKAGARRRATGESRIKEALTSSPLHPLTPGLSRQATDQGAAFCRGTPLHPTTPAEPVGGAVPLGSPFYVVRPTDWAFEAALARRDSIVLVKGTRQVGKTSLLARGFHQARQAGCRVILTDFEALNRVHLESADALLLTLAHTLADQLDLRVSPHDVWDPRRGPNPNFRRYLEREVLSTLVAPLVWGLDQVDRLFACEFGPELFALFRSWHNERALDPSGPWARLTLAIAYSTEVHLFITDLDQSPFNVGTRLTLEDFTREQTGELNRRSGAPLRDEGELSRFYVLLGGHPYLVRRGLQEMTTRGIDLATFEAHAAGDHGIFGDHLRRILVSLARDPELCEAVRAVLEGRPCPTLESFFRLRSAGVVTGRDEADARLRCPLYAIYLARHLPQA